MRFIALSIASPGWIKISLCFVAIAFVWTFGCTQPLRLVDYPEYHDLRSKHPGIKLADSIALVGTIKADVSIAKPIPSHWDPNMLLQLRRVDVNVENVLRGNLPSRLAEVFYFTFAIGYNGPPPLGGWAQGQRILLFIQHDSNVLRMACDGVGSCARQVNSGRHSDLKTVSQGALGADTLAQLFLTKGREVTDGTFAASIIDGLSECDFIQIQESGQTNQRFEIERLQALVRDQNSAEVRKSACEALDDAFKLKCGAERTK